MPPFPQSPGVTMVRLLLVLLWLVLAPLPAHADLGYFTCSGQGVAVSMPACVGNPPTSGGIGGYPYPDLPALCEGYRSWIASGSGVSNTSVYTCPAAVGGNMVIKADYGGATYYSTSSAQSSTGYPTPNPCTAGVNSTKTMNFTTGWARSSTADASDYVIVHPSPTAGTGEACDGQCIVDVQGLQECWRSQVPGPTGLHRISCDYTVKQSAATCTTKSANTDPTTAPPPCPGTQGSVNGKPVCFGTAGGTPLPELESPTQAPEGFGNPSSGDKPPSGPGSGTGPNRTPAVGTGSNDGGGSTAVVPGGGSDGNGQVDPGTVPGGGPGNTAGTEVNVETCGLPGKPACKIDESGTGTGVGAYNAEKSAFDAAATGERSGITGSGSSVSGVAWAWAFTLPSGTCTPFNLGTPLGAWEINPCTSPGIALMRSILGYLLFVLGALYIWRSATSSPPGAR